MLIAMAMACCPAFGVYMHGRVRGPKAGEGRPLDLKVVDRSKNKVSTNAVVIADGVWKEHPGGLFGKKFGEAIPGSKMLSGGADGRYVTFQPEKRFRKFSNYRQLVDPRTRLVYGLTCSAKFIDANEARAEVEEVKGILKQKFPKGWKWPSELRVGYGEDGECGVFDPYWTVAVTMVAPKSGRQISTAVMHEVVIRAIDSHFFPAEGAEPPAPSGDLDAL